MNTLEDHFQQITINKKPAELYVPIAYILQQGGKRIRPRLVMMSTALFGGDPALSLYPAAAFEMLHNFTLIHDDIMDQAPIRRGKETVHKKWNSNIAILSGDALATLALQQILMTPCQADIIVQMASVFAQTSVEICEGQQYDLCFETDTNVTLNNYIEMIRLKTAVMLAGCLKVGAILAKADVHNQQAIYNFGINLGIAFQIKDDILDVYAEDASFGKMIGGDIKDNKKTYLYLQALTDADPQQKNSLLSCFSRADLSFEEKFKTITTLYDQLDIKAKTEAVVSHYIDKALSDLETITVDNEKKAPFAVLASELCNRIK